MIKSDIRIKADINFVSVMDNEPITTGNSKN